MGSKKPSKPTTGFKYFIDMHSVITNGEVSRIHGMQAGDKVISTDVLSANGTIQIDKEKIFGGTDKEGGIKGPVSIYFGREGQGPITGVGVDGVAYLGVFSAVMKKVYIGVTPYMKPWSYDIETNFEVDNPSPMSQNAIAFITSVESSIVTARGDMNPAHIIYALITSPDYGLGYTNSDLDQDSFNSAALVLHNEGFGLSFQWSEEQSVEDFLTEIIKHIDAAVYIHPLTGLFTLKLLRFDYVVEDLITFNQSNVSDILKYDRPALGEIVNEVTVTYIDGESGKSKPISRRNSALYSKQGYKVMSTVSLPGISSYSLADIVCQKKLQSLSAPLASLELETNRDAANLGIGDVINFVWPELEIVSMILRIVDIAYGSSDSNTIKLTCIQDIFSLASTVFSSDSGSDWVNTTSPPTDVTTYKIGELPYAVLLPESAALNYEFTPTSYTQVLHCIEAPTEDTTNVQLYVENPQAVYDFSGESTSNPTLTLARTLSYSGTTLYYRERFYADLLQAGDFLLINEEWCLISSINTSAQTMVIVRGCFDTRPRRHLNGSLIYGLIYTMALTDEVARYLGNVLKNKYSTSTGNGVLALADATVHNYTCIARQYLPYSPGYPSYKATYLGGSTNAFDLGITADMSWVSRNRLTQRDSIIGDSTASGSAEEALITYYGKVTDDLNSLSLSKANITFVTTDLTSFNLSLAPYVRDLEVPMISFDLYSSRSGQVCYQPSRNPVNILLQYPIDEYSNLVYSFSPTHYYKLNDYSSKYSSTISYVTDSVASAPIHGIYMGSPTLRNETLIPKSMMAGTYFESASYAYFSGNLIPETTGPNYTISMWIKIIPQSPPSRQYLYNAPHVDTDTFQLSIFVLNNLLYVYKTDETAPLFTPVSISDSTIYFVAVTDNGTNVSLLINGVLIETTTRSSYSTSLTSFTCLGHNPLSTDSETFGDMSHVAIFASALTAPNLLSLYNKGVEAQAIGSYDDVLQVYTPTLWYKMDERTLTLGTGSNDTFDSGSAGIDAKTKLSLATTGVLYPDVSGYSAYVSKGLGFTYTKNWAGNDYSPASTTYGRTIISHNVVKDPLAVLGDVATPFSIVFFARLSNASIVAQATTWEADAPLFLLANAVISPTKVTACFGIDTNFKTHFASKNGATEGIIKGNKSIDDNMYHMFCIAVDTTANTVKIYIDGHIDSEGSYIAGSFIGVGNPVFSSLMSREFTSLGDYSSSHTSGQLTNFAIIPSVLTSAQVRNLHASANCGTTPLYTLDSTVLPTNITLSGSNRTATMSGATNFALIKATDGVNYTQDFSFEVLFSSITYSVQTYIGLCFGTLLKAADRNSYIGSSNNATIGLKLDGTPVFDGLTKPAITDLASVAGDTIQLIVLGSSNLILARKSTNKVPVVVHGDMNLVGAKIYPAISLYGTGDAATINLSTPTFDVLKGVASYDGVSQGELTPPTTRLVPDPTYTYNNGIFTFNNTMFHVKTVSGYSNGYLSQSRNSGIYAFEYRQTYKTAAGAWAGISNARSSSTSLHVGGLANGIGHSISGTLKANNVSTAVTAVPKNEWVMMIIDFGTRTITLKSSTIGSVATVLSLANMPNTSYYPGFSLNELASGIEFNMGDRAFTNTLPTGNISWDGSQVGV